MREEGCDFTCYFLQKSTWDFIGASGFGGIDVLQQLLDTVDIKYQGINGGEIWTILLSVALGVILVAGKD